MSRKLAVSDAIGRAGIRRWPGIRIERREDGVAVVRYEHSELGLLYRDRGVAELRSRRPSTTS